MARSGIGFSPYNRQPPSCVRPALSTSITQGLIYASSIPHEGVWSRKIGNKRPTPGNANFPTYSKSVELGKTILFDRDVLSPVEYIGCEIVNPPLTLMMNLRIAEFGGEGVVLSFGGSSTAGGWAFEWNDFSGAAIWYGGDARYDFGIPSAQLELNVDYTAVLTIDVAGAANLYYKRKDNRTDGIRLYSVATGTAIDPATKPLTLGCMFDGGTSNYTYAFGGHIGSFALWERVLPLTDVHATLYNPFRIWYVPNYGTTTQQDVTTGFTSPAGMTGSLGTVSVIAKATAPVTGVQATGAVGTVIIPNVWTGFAAVAAATGAVGAPTISGAGNVTVASPALMTASLGVISVGGGVTLLLTGFQATASLGSITSVKANAGHTLTGLAATSALGSVTTAIGFGALANSGMKGDVGTVEVAGWNAVVTDSTVTWTKIQAGG